MMGIKFVSFFASLLVSASALASDVRYAIIQLDGAGHRVLVTDVPIASGASVSIQYPGGKRGTACCKRLAALVAASAITFAYFKFEKVRQPSLGTSSGEALI